MAVAPFFDRVYGAVGGHLAISRESLTGTLNDIVAGVHVASALSENRRWTAELTVNLLARLYPRLALTAPEPLRTTLEAVARAINPTVEFVSTAPHITTLRIGRTADARTVNAGDVTIDASGWVAYVGTPPDDEAGLSNPYAAGAAACLGVAELFRRVFLKAPPAAPCSVSLLDYCGAGQSVPLPRVDLRNVLFAGVGAVGNAAIWALSRHEHVTGTLICVDAENLELSNLQRYVLGTMSDVSRAKVDLARQAFSSSALQIDGRKMSLEQAADKLGENWDVICVSVDNIPTRRAAQGLLPRIAINGWTGDRSLGASWHVFSQETACLACLYHPKGVGASATEQAARALGLTNERAALLWLTRQPLSDDDLSSAAKSLGVHLKDLKPWRGRTLGDLYTDVICGAVPLNVGGIGRVEAVPLAHQSVLAGIMMAAELVKRLDPKLSQVAQREPLVTWEDVLAKPPLLWTRPRPRERGCICTDNDYQDVYARKWSANEASEHRAIRLRD